MRTKIFAVPICLALASVALPADTAGRPYELLLSGPAESVDFATNTVIVLGHTFVVRDASRFAPGHKLNVFGGFRPNGSIGASFIQDTAEFAASGDQVFAAGAVTVVNGARGLMAIGGATVDYTSLLAQPRFRLPVVGDVVAITGIQPRGKGVVLAAEIHRVYGVTAGGVVAKGVTAGGVVAKGVTAGGVVAKGVTAGGVVAKGVTAGGVVAKGVTAGGVVANGVTAGGVVAKGVTAGGVVAKGVTAGGVVAKGVTAGGVVAKGVTAGGVVAKGVTAGGVVAKGVTAGGVVAKGVTAGGVVAKGVTAGGKSST